MREIDKTPKVSVCVITYNQEKYISQCLQSIVDQVTDFEFEVIVGDDCSSDNTANIVLGYVSRYPKLIKLIQQKTNTGGGKNHLQVHSLAKGFYVAHVDGDDYLLPGKLQLQAEVFDADLGCTAIWHRVDLLDDFGKFASGMSADLSIFTNGLVTFEQSIRLGFIGVHSSLMYRREALGTLDPNERLLDLYFTWHLLAKGHGRYINKVLGVYRIYSNNSISNKSRERVGLLAIDHARYFLNEYPYQKENFAIWAICHAIISAYQARKITLDYIAFIIKNMTWIHPRKIIKTIRERRTSKAKWVKP